MTPKMAIERKREGLALAPEDIREFVQGFASGEIPDCQAAAFAMAVCCRGMDAEETAALTDAMLHSGAVLSWEDLDRPSADKHSTGGVGDKLSFIVLPMAAACGVAVPSLVGRGLGLTGGTADKLESIPGFRAAIPLSRFREIVRGAGLSMAAQTAEIAPADGKLYALRDVTGTVASIPLIVSSILSKKLAEGAGALVFDVKCGRGAFMKTRAEAAELAAALVSGAKAAGRKAAALVTDMDAPLGRAVGNACEVAEALEILSGATRGADGERLPEVALSLTLAALMVSLARGIPEAEAYAECEARLDDGAALAAFRRSVAAQGGDLDAFSAEVRRPVFRFAVQAERAGRVAEIDAGKVALAALELGAGRKKPGDAIDPRAGVELAARRGSRVAPGDILATLSKSGSPDGLEQAAACLAGAFAISRDAPPQASLVLERFD